MTFRIDNISFSSGRVWITFKASTGGGSRYFTAISGEDGKGLFHLEIARLPENCDIFLTKQEFAVGNDEVPADIAKRFARIMICKGLGPMVDMENNTIAQTVEEIDAVKFEETGHVGKYR